MPKKFEKVVDYTVRTVTATPKKEFIPTGEFVVGSLPAAKIHADNLQAEHDKDCDPCRTYVYRSHDPKVPIYAGLQRREYGGYRG